MKLRCIIVDDEPLALKLMESNAGMVDFLHHKGSFSDAASAIRFLDKNEIDLIFLDIQMPGISGMEMAKNLNGPMIIFTTAFDHYAIQGFEVRAVDYLLKPITLKRFRVACEKAKESFDLKRLPGKDQPDHIMIRSEHRRIRVFYNDIQYVEGLKDYVKIHLLSEPKPVLTRTNLGGFGEQLPEKFIRVHKSFIVNMKHVRSANKDSIVLRNITVPLGASYKRNFLEALKPTNE